MDEEYEINIDDVMIDISSVIDSKIEVSTVGAGTVWLDTSENKFYVHDGVSWNLPPQEVLFENTMPNPVILTEMCKEYPALEKAYENFKAIYKLVEQDWNGKQKENGEPPF